MNKAPTKEKIVFCQHCNEPVIQSKITINGLCLDCDKAQSHYHHQFDNWLDMFFNEMQPNTVR
jgi:hypothetical protein